ncbi:Membrane proteinase PrsW, cleaves anti-sigma factor RsiW, M82 family [Nocardioides terrae]|uniref:Membrane proteinase PrsW, cleaves anti-sigma factor RsiW, M82 family n=1 Tax=Nocardioides terrae TaxID=574651 RepID=A0A1I1DQG0_9ACTN|nr:PrsW family intramembrane metalloprotease [Nocardioides terrae]SFB76652.1 Membrane proteinase PrsW, cleaves anti-sigma factor RsiW, M82 family [Nocardioides terrae]
MGAGTRLTRRRRASGTVFTVVVSIVVVLAALPMLLLIAFSGAPTTLLIATLLAALPVVPLVAGYLWLDRYEPEPHGLLALGLLWGAFVACFAAVVLEGVGGVVTGLTGDLSSAVLAPVVEEACKGAFLLALLWWRRDELDGILDGIVYAGMVGIGFAFTENILYLAAAYDGTDGIGPGGLDALTRTFVVRCLASPFAHPLFTAFTGVGIGIAVGARSGALRLLAPLGGYACAVVTHALWNSSTVYGLGGFVLVYVVLIIPVLCAIGALALWARSSERRMLARSLGDAAARGLLPATDIGWVVDLAARRRSRAYARAVGGAAAERAMRDYQQAAIELGYLHYRYLRGTPPPNFAARGQEYVARIGRVRPTIAFPGQVVPTR